jgi:hypothetical protein
MRCEEEVGALKKRGGQDPVDKRRGIDDALKSRSGDGDKAKGTPMRAQFSYRDAMVRPRTFRPHFLPEGSHQSWLHQDS